VGELAQTTTRARLKAAGVTFEAHAA
jgi:hypothetical protein